MRGAKYRPLPLTDLVIHPKDGAMYFAVGGRGTESAVYRVTYTGNESTAPAPAPKPNAGHKLRRELEQLHEDGTGPEAVAKAWPHLGNPDDRLFVSQTLGGRIEDGDAITLRAATLGK